MTATLRLFWLKEDFNQCQELPVIESEKELSKTIILSQVIIPDLDQSDRSQESLVMKSAKERRMNEGTDFAFRQQVVFFQRNTRKKL